MNPTALVSTRCMLALIDESECAGKTIVSKLHEPPEELSNKRHPSNKSNSVLIRIKSWFRTSSSSQRQSLSQSHVPLSTTTTREQIKTSRKDDTYLGKSFADMNEFEREIEDELHDIHRGVRRLSELATQMNEKLNDPTSSKTIRAKTI